ESRPGSVGRRDREGSLLGPSYRGRALSGVRGELRAPGLPGALVRAVTAVHVSVSRRRVLRGRLARVGAAAARVVRVPVRGPWGRALGARRTTADTVEAGLSSHGGGVIR